MSFRDLRLPRCVIVTATTTITPCAFFVRPFAPVIRIVGVPTCAARGSETDKYEWVPDYESVSFALLNTSKATNLHTPRGCCSPQTAVFSVSCLCVRVHARGHTPPARRRRHRSRPSVARKTRLTAFCCRRR